MSEWIQDNSSVLITRAKSCKITWYQITQDCMIQNDPANIRYTWYNASIHSPVPASGSRNAGKPATKRTNMLQTNQYKSQKTWTNRNKPMISHHQIHHQILISNRWKLRRRPSTSASRIISSTSSSVSFSSAEWYTHWLIHFIHHIVFSTPHGKSLHISRIYHGILCAIWMCLVLHGIVWHLIAEFGTPRHGIAMGMV